MLAPTLYWPNFCSPPDHLVVLYDEDVSDLAPEFFEHVWWRECDEHGLEIVCPTSSNVDLAPILLAAENRKAKCNQITVLFAHLERETLKLLLEHWDSVNLIGCALGEGWWDLAHVTKKCTCLSFDGCAVASPPNLATGRAAWGGLSSLRIDERCFDRRLHSDRCFEPDPIPRHESSYASNPHSLLKAFWGCGIQDLSISDWAESPRLHELHPPSGLEWVSITGTPTSVEDFVWLTECSTIENLALSWLPETRMPWEWLGKLNALRFLDLSSSQCTDDDLSVILDHTSLSTIHLYYSRASNACLAKLLSTKSMRMVWASAEVFSGEVPADLPETSRVRELVALNGGLNYARQVAKRYPRMTVSEM